MVSTLTYGPANAEGAAREAAAAAKKGDSVSKIASKLQQTTKEMKQVVKKWKDSEGAEKEELKNRLRELTKIKKELEGLL